MRGMRHKEWPLIPDWLDVFGNDRATGAVAEDMSDAAAKMKDHYNTHNSQSETDFLGENIINQDDQSGTRPTSSRLHEEQAENSCADASIPLEQEPCSGKKRKTKTSSSDPLIAELLRDLCRTTGDRLDNIARRIGYDFNLGEKRAKVYGMLRDVPGLSMVQKLDVTQIIGSKVEILEIFMGLPEDARALYAIRLLEKASG